jgi:3D (Asp-Asp-Asp) domain-containing protein
MKVKIASGMATAVALSLVGATLVIHSQAQTGSETLNARSAPELQNPSSTAPATPTTADRSPPTTSATTKPVPLAAPNASGPITFYAARDNDPPGSRAIAYPGILHDQAGGSGTFADPLTFATAVGVFKPGTRIYVPDVQLYFILEDTCASCSGHQIDLWAGPATDSGVVACEESLTRGGARPYEVNPPPGRPVVAGDLYQSGKCYQP